MQQTASISKSIVRISARSFEHNVEAVSGSGITHNKLIRLNNALDKLYDAIYKQFNVITSEDYKLIEPQLMLLLNTLRGLNKTYKRLRISKPVSDEVAALGRNYSAIYELNSDIKNFRIKKISPELSRALHRASDAMNLI